MPRRVGGGGVGLGEVCPCSVMWCFMESLRLVDLVDLDVLQKIQDSFAAAMRLRVVTRDAGGQEVTRASEPTRLAELVECATLKHQCGPPLTPEEAKAWVPTAERPFAVVRYVESIGVERLCLGSIEVTALLARGELTPACLAHFGEEHTGQPEDLLPLLRDRASWGARELDAVGRLVGSIAGLLSVMCEKGYESVRKVREVLTLYDVSQLMTQTMELQGRLDLLTKITTATLGVRGCLIRLLDEANGELNVKSVHNLSQRYLEKGPVNLSDSVVDQEAILGGAVYVEDVTLDSRTLYPREMAEEGLCSMLCVALRSKGRVIGTLRVYTGEPHEFTTDETRMLRAIANQAATALENAELYEESLRAQAMDMELAAAAAIQRRLIPSANPVIPGFDIASRYVPYEIVGGDLFDFVPIQDQHLGIVIADVAGKGVP
ncbi:MAG TPA: GAF domain-containing protein, partial [Planctomycetota bacterium]|nr:GAF domain-containing protein [Planctomycetota bacterium]